ncbi:MAG: phosphoribosylformylglycinamidine cyclo-ligase [Spirochaetota bacterium]
MGLTYRESGVDIDKGDRFVDMIKGKLKPDERENIGLFGGLFDLSKYNLKHPMLVASTDGVGTKLLLAKEAKRYGTIGIDLVAMCVNDVITTGAKPLFFLDYMASADIELKTASEVIDGMIEGCRQAGCILLGGETAEMPGVYQKGEYELAGFAVGIVERNRVIDGSRIEVGDVLVGIPSNGIHSNGISLARKALFEKRGYSYDFKPAATGKSLIEELLIPTRIYVKLVLELLDKYSIRGIAHITGGGLMGNIVRIVPEGLEPLIKWECIKPHPIFSVIQDAGEIEDNEMRKVFNMGIGFVLVLNSKEGEGMVSYLRSRGEEALIIGEIVEKRS